MVAYSPKEFLDWWLRAKEFRKVDTRRKIVWTRSAQLVMVCTLGLLFFTLGVSLGFTFLSLNTGMIYYQFIGFAVLVAYPFLLPLELLIVVWLGDVLVIRPRQKRRIAASKQIFTEHPGTIIAVAGSYGKTTMKEILRTVLSEGGKTAATPGNKNVAISHARFAESLDGDERFVIVEFGEGYKGDVARFSETVQPDIAIVTGLAPNHLDQYGTLTELKNDLLSAVQFVGKDKAFVCGDAEDLQGVDAHIYDEHVVLGWKVTDIKNTVEGLSFTLRKQKRSISISSRLIGRHLIASLSLAAALADTLGLTKEQIEDGIAKTTPFEHRLEPRSVHGAWIIDDTYNGSIEGMRAGLRLLKELEAKKRKIYVTPGLVDQGAETEKVHTELGALIADARPDLVVLMNNSATSTIQQSMKDSGYSGELLIVDDPLHYYENLDLSLAAGDIALLQNDWTDNYA